MKFKMITIVGIILTGSLVFTHGCSYSGKSEHGLKEANRDMNGSTEKQKSDSLAEVIKAKHHEDWLLFKLEAEENIAENDKRINELNAQIREKGKLFDKVRADRVIALEQQNKDLRNKLNNYKHEEGTWESFKEEFNHDMKEVGDALKDLTVNNM
jgi:hypothetical protein